MKKPFTEEEISIASKKLKNGKSPRIDSMKAEYIKDDPGTTHQIIVNILRKSVETDGYLRNFERRHSYSPTNTSKENQEGREENKQFKTSHSVTNCQEDFCNMRNRTDMGKTERSCTKRSSSLLKRNNHNRKVITSENYILIVTMIDVSKTFDTFNRKTLLEKLETILDESEIRMMNDVLPHKQL